MKFNILSLKPMLIAGGASLIVGSAGGFWLGNKLGDAKVDRINNKLLIRTHIIHEKTDAVGAEVGSKTAEKEVQIRTFTNTIERQVPTYVPLKGSCDIAPSGFVSVLDAAATGTNLPTSPAEPPDTPSAFKYDQVANVTVGNYGICRETAERLSGLQEWVVKTKEIYDKKGK